MKAILLVDHGSRRRQSNDMMICMANLVQTMAGGGIVVRYAHMEFAEPTIAQGFAHCVEAGATEVIVFPYLLSPGQHSTSDIPRMVGEASANHRGVTFSVTPPFGVQEALGQIILGRAGIKVDPAFTATDASRCWDPQCSETLCGDACRARQPASGTDRMPVLSGA